MKKSIHNIAKREQTGLGYLGYPLAFIAAAVIALSQLFGDITPMAPAFMGSLVGGNCLFAFLGSLLIFAIKGQVLEAFPTLLSMIVIGGFRTLIQYAPQKVIGISSSLVTGIGVISVGVITASQPSEVMAGIAAGIAAGGVQFCLSTVYKSFDRGTLSTTPNISSAISGNIVMIFLAAVLSGVSISNEIYINLGVLVGAIITLSSVRGITSRFLSLGNVAVMITAGVIFSMSDLSPAMIMFALAGVLSGYLTQFGKTTQAALFILVLGVGISVVGINTFSLSVMAAASAGAGIYVIIPEGIMPPAKTGGGDSYSGDGFGFGEARANNAGKGEDISEIFANRLRLASNALSDVKSAVEKTGELLDKRNVKDFSFVYNAASDIVCKKCKHNMICWGEEYDQTVTCLDKLSMPLRKNTPLSDKHLPKGIVQRCEHKREFIYAINDRYREFISLSTANRKIAEMRTVLTAQLSATENLMLDMSNEFLDYSHYDEEMAKKIEKILLKNGIENPKVAAIVFEGRITIEGYGKGKLCCDGSQLGDEISSVLKRQFDLPETFSSKGEFRFMMYERALYSVEYGAYQLAKFNERSCGDYYDSFVDKKGYAYIILSDGMGSGSRARIDSSFACSMLIKLLRAGIGIQSSLEIINNSLLVKSSDESFATLDICRIDMYTGKAEIYKAGAAASYVRLGKRLAKIDGTGLPVGIGHKAIYEKKSFVVGKSDMIIMASDGVEINEKWLEHHFSDKTYPDLNEAAKYIANTARFNKDDDDLDKGENKIKNISYDRNRDDDISVIAVKLVK